MSTIFFFIVLTLPSVLLYWIGVPYIPQYVLFDILLFWLLSSDACKIFLLFKQLEAWKVSVWAVRSHNWCSRHADMQRSYKWEFTYVLELFGRQLCSRHRWRVLVIRHRGKNKTTTCINTSSKEMQYLNSIFKTRLGQNITGPPKLGLEW